MAGIPVEEKGRRDEDEPARDSLAGDIARELDPDIDEPDSEGSGTEPRDNR